MTTVTRCLSAGRITMSSSFFSRLRACCSALVNLLPCSDADCIVEAILLLMLSLIDSDSSRYRAESVSVRMTVREFHSCLRDGKRYSIPSCRPVYFVAVLCCVEVVSVSVDVQYGHVQLLCWLVCRQ